MGLWSKACSWVKEKATQAKNWVVEKYNQAKDGVKKVWNAFTGKKTFEEAEELYNRISERYNSRRRKFESDVDTYSHNIENHVNAINGYKERIKKELFPQMAEKLKQLCDVNISEEFNFEEFEIGNYSFDGLRAKEQLYKIDFNKHPIKSNALAILTLGIYTRKKAKETLYAVQEEEAKINNEIAKMDIETKRLEAINLSLSNIDMYFDELTSIYENLLVRLDSSVNFLFVRCMSFAHKIIRQEMSVRYLSRVQVKEIEAIVTASKILKAMTEMQIVSIENQKNVSDYEKTMKKHHDEIITEYRVA
ncbi:MAG: DNA repair protein [Ruminococcaceae bacterium]|nr:DNA repair protein [Oscillospiraceae bacterium]